MHFAFFLLVQFLRPLCLKHHRFFVVVHMSRSPLINISQRIKAYTHRNVQFCPDNDGLFMSEPLFVKPKHAMSWCACTS